MSNQHHESPECISSALFLHNMWDILLILAPLALAVISLVMVSILCSTVAPDADKDTKTTSGTNVGNPEGTSIPLSGSTEEQQMGLDQPPPYQPPESVATPTATEKRAARQSTARAFVRGTVFLILMVAALFLLALCIQFIVYCNVWSPAPHYTRAIFWTLYSLVCIYATKGALTWAVLLRNLWGPAVVKRYPIKVDVLSSSVFMILIFPPTLVGTCIFMAVSFTFESLGRWSVITVEACQKCCCGVGLDEDDEREWTELEEGRALVASEDETDGDGTSQAAGKNLT